MLHSRFRQLGWLAIGLGLLATSCAKTTYLLNDGPVSGMHNQVSIEGINVDTYKGELSPGELARGCSSRKIKALQVSYAALNAVLVHFSSNKTAVDIDVYCLASKGKKDH